MYIYIYIYIIHTHIYIYVYIYVYIYTYILTHTHQAVAPDGTRETAGLEVSGACQRGERVGARLAPNTLAGSTADG